MNIQSSYDEILEETQCPKCGKIGMLPNGDLNYVCPCCDYEGTLEDEKD